MPDPKTCAAKFKKGSKAYKDCIAYKNTKKPRSTRPGKSY